jgi:hypothetical protein
VANSPKLTNRGANAAADAVTALLNSGILRLYTGTQPATADTGISGNTLLAQLTFGNPAFGAANNGTATANAITSDGTADASGTATWFRALDSGGVDVTDNVFDGSVGTSGCDLNMNSNIISAGAAVSISSLTYTQSKS